MDLSPERPDRRTEIRRTAISPAVVVGSAYRWLGNGLVELTE
jgi:hypothetical protein